MLKFLTEWYVIVILVAFDIINPTSLWHNCYVVVLLYYTSWFACKLTIRILSNKQARVSFTHFSVFDVYHIDEWVDAGLLMDIHNGCNAISLHLPSSRYRRIRALDSRQKKIIARCPNTNLVSRLCIPNHWYRLIESSENSSVPPSVLRDMRHILSPVTNFITNLVAQWLRGRAYERFHTLLTPDACLNPCP